jgi:Asp-tRNA(Asn)/Glu-tRNA(Gln) amidotransferase A subunit family amidase
MFSQASLFGCPKFFTVNSPMDEELCLLSATELKPRLQSGEIRALELAESCLARISEYEETIKAWTYINPDHVRAQAIALDEYRQSGATIGPMHGLPVGLKDIIDTKDMPTENGTQADSGRVPREDAVLVKELKAAGALIMGKTVTWELAHNQRGKTKNPRDPNRTPGGSSSGSAAAVAMGMVPLAVGTQTGGSIIRPASYCGVVGFKSTHNLISTHGIFMGSHTLDTVGVFGRSVDDVALISEAMTGYGPNTTIQPRPRPALVKTAKSAPPVQPTFALVRPPEWELAEADMRDAFDEINEALGSHADLVELPTPFAKASNIHKTISLVELSKYGAKYALNHSDAMSKEFLSNIEEGAAYTGRDYLTALDWVEILNAGLDEIFERYDAIITPAAAGEAPVGLEDTGNGAFSRLWTLCGTPTISLPLLTGSNGMPMGVQLVGPRGDDGRLLRTANWLMQFTAETE